MDRPPLLIVDAANVVGSRPDGWWRDRAGAAARLRDSLAPVAAAGLPPELPAPVEVVLVVEGAARDVPAHRRGPGGGARPAPATTPIVELVAGGAGAPPAGGHRRPGAARPGRRAGRRGVRPALAARSRAADRAE